MKTNTFPAVARTSVARQRCGLGFADFFAVENSALGYMALALAAKYDGDNERAQMLVEIAVEHTDGKRKEVVT